MGWTSMPYRGQSTQTTMEAKEAFQFLRDEFTSFQFAAFHFIKAKDKYDKNEIYAIARNNNTGKAFIMIMLIDIVDNEIYYKYMSETEGPAYENCPYKFFDFVKDPGFYATNWRKKCNEKKINYKTLLEYY